MGTFSLILLETQLALLFLATSSVTTPHLFSVSYNFVELYHVLAPVLDLLHLSLQIHFLPFFFLLHAPGGWFLQMAAQASWLPEVGFEQWEASAGYWNVGRRYS